MEYLFYSSPLILAGLVLAGAKIAAEIRHYRWKKACAALEEAPATT